MERICSAFSIVDTRNKIPLFENLFHSFFLKLMKFQLQKINFVKKIAKIVFFLTNSIDKCIAIIYNND